MRKILNSFSPLFSLLLIDVKISKKPIFAVLAFWHFVIAVLVRINKQILHAIIASLGFVIDNLVDTNKRLFHAIITSWNLLITGMVNITKQVIHAILNSFRFLVTSLVTLNKQLFRATVAFLHATASFFGFVISSLVRLINQFISAFLNFLGAIVGFLDATINTLVSINKQIISGVVNGIIRFLDSIISFFDSVINSLFRIKKQFVNGVAFFGIAIVDSSGFIADSFIRINKQVLSGVANGILSSFGTIVSFLGAVVNSFGAGAVILGAAIVAVLATLVGINKKLIHGVIRGVVKSLSAVLSSMGFVLTSLVRINKQIIHATVALPRFVITGLIKITKHVIHAISTSLRKIPTWCSFGIAGLVVVAAFMTAKNYGQLGAAILLYPLPVYFAFKAFPRKTLRYASKKPVTASEPPVKLAEKVETDRENVNIVDIDKRAFLKLIGATGLSLFLFSIFNKKAEGLFSKSLPGSGRVSLEAIDGDKIDPAQAQPTDGYRISEVDDNAITFYGFINKDGAWFVMKEDTDTGAFRYARGNSNFPGNWTRRKNLKYDYFNNVF